MFHKILQADALEKLDRELEKLGERGWELVSCCWHAETRRWVAFLKSEGEGEREPPLFSED